jgi:transcriptional regulator with XRE-family HTH domain
MTFAQALDAAISRHRWSHRKAGELLGVTHTQVGRYLGGQEPTLNRAIRLADVLGVSLDAMMGRSSPERPWDVVVDGIRYAPVTAAAGATTVDDPRTAALVRRSDTLRAAGGALGPDGTPAFPQGERRAAE